MLFADKLNGGAIIDHEWAVGKTLIMCVSGLQKKRLGLVINAYHGSERKVHEIAQTFCTLIPMQRYCIRVKKIYPANVRGSSTK